ncbi:GSCFA domain-containing protein [Pseudodesulfovibrio indicus]|uniref:Tetratricopeptide repeat protein n=1 Tax=Pseudodesulfovibrio indicus TaxID=1716143 RepID=A0A140D9L6_9BACT|nr:GSCFA domain-containing protein [Pseudodesulfovibrio indicus]AMK09883.1 hypothetical protein AWY79_01535 [Pseudodesulfovibrio indicus]TDT87436.1 tetratricopeptide repeat protein [Pseudodesulfovibrio indicus]
MDISHWSKASPRLKPQVWPAVTAKGRIPEGSTVFTMGSCFARNIEKHLQRLGFAIPTLDFSVPKEEFPMGGGNGMLNKYTPPSIFQEISWAARIHDRDGVVVAEDLHDLTYPCQGGYVDLQLGGYVPVGFDRLLERRQQLYDVVRNIFSCGLVVMTLGLIEAWRDTKTGLFIQQAPSIKEMIRDRERFVFHLLSHGECLGFVEDAIALVRARNPKARFLLTTSPIPLGRTFTDDDVIVANLHSKSKLRSVCGELAAREEVEYFPSFESVMLTKDWDIWYPDLRHVEGFFVGEIVNRLCDAYFDSSESARLYQRSFCCKSNEESVELMRAALELEEKAEYHSRLGGLYRLAGRLDEAIESFRNANRLDPAEWETYRHLAILEEKKGCFKEALLWLARGEEHWPTGNGELHLIQSRLSNKSHDRAAAVESMKRALDADPSLMKNKLSQGQVLLSVKQVDRAALVANEVINYNLSIPDSHREAGCLAQARLLLSRAHEHAGRLDEAVAEAEKAAALDNGDSEIRAHLATLRER